ncbi:MAG TPA: hypothetical protein VF960_06480 [Chloroflexota bacterium]
MPMSISRDIEHTGSGMQAIEVLLHALSHEVESQAYLQMAVRVVDDPDLRAFLIDILGQEQVHEIRLRSKLRDLYSLDV